jgi:hypothetical protein
MGGACSPHGRNEKYLHVFVGESEVKKDNLEDLDVDGDIILE